MGEYDKALPYHERALAMNRKLYRADRFPDGHANLSSSLNNLRILLKTMGKYGKAFPYYERTLATTQMLYPADRLPHGHVNLPNVSTTCGFCSRRWSSTARRCLITSSPWPLGRSSTRPPAFATAIPTWLKASTTWALCSRRWGSRDESPRH
jgi:tetratricopeptide (TPR) repeat protein